MIMIPDTGYLIDVLKGDKKAVQKSEELKDGVHTQNLCTPVIYEVMTGIEYTGSQKERVIFESIIQKFTVFPYDEKSARLSAKIHAELLREGKERGSVDIQIASIALSNGETLLTNDSDYHVISEIFGLQLERY